MAAVSQLAEFGRSFRQPAAPGVEVIDSPRYRMQLVPDFPIPGPNHVTWLRCGPEDVENIVREARAVFAARGLPFSWILDPDVEPHDLAERLSAHGVRPDPHGETAAVMVLPAVPPLEDPGVDGLRMHDALESYETFEAADHVADEAFSGAAFGSPSFLDAHRPRRYENGRAASNRRVVLATVHGEPAGSASVTMHPPGGAFMNGGAVRPAFRGLGVYRAMVAARMRMIREAGAAGAVVWGGDMSRPILEKLGFQTVGWRKFYVDG